MGKVNETRVSIQDDFLAIGSLAVRVLREELESETPQVEKMWVALEIVDRLGVGLQHYGLIRTDPNA